MNFCKDQQLELTFARLNGLRITPEGERVATCNFALNMKPGLNLPRDILRGYTAMKENAAQDEIGLSVEIEHQNLYLSALPNESPRQVIRDVDVRQLRYVRTEGGIELRFSLRIPVDSASGPWMLASYGTTVFGRFEEVQPELFTPPADAARLPKPKSAAPATAHTIPGPDYEQGAEELSAAEQAVASDQVVQALAEPEPAADGEFVVVDEPEGAPPLRTCSICGAEKVCVNTASGVKCTDCVMAPAEAEEAATEEANRAWIDPNAVGGDVFDRPATRRGRKPGSKNKPKVMVN